VAVAGVRAVHSPRAKRLFLNRLAERRGITTLAALLQVALRLRDVNAHVTIEEVSSDALARLDGDAQLELLRVALLRAISA
jgi:hypothetical protein